MPIVFATCDVILNDSLCPLHYRILTDAAIKRIGTDPSSLNLTAQYEDVREKYCQRKGVKYVPRPHCLIYLDKWLPKPNLINPFGDYKISCNIHDSIIAFQEGLLRDKYMVNKHDIPDKSRSMKRAIGLLIQHHVSNWFECNWPDMFIKPDNEGIYNRPCSHDFKLKVDGRLLLVDVMGKDYKGKYDLGDKHPVDIHIFGYTDKELNTITIDGYKCGVDFINHSALESRPIQWMIFRLNTYKHGYDWQLFKQ
jgi:hypothetical protein